MKKSLRGLAAIVTGASRGIGRATALALAEEGVRLGLVARSGDALDSLAGQIRAQGGEAHPLVVDMGDIGGIPATASDMAGSLGNVDFLVNNAGTFHESPFAEMEVEDLEQTLRVNLTAPFLLTRELLAHTQVGQGTGGEHREHIGDAGLRTSVGLLREQARTAGPDAGAGAGGESGRRPRAQSLPGRGGPDFIKDTKLGERLAGQAMIAPEDIAQMVVFLLKQPFNIDLPEMVVRRFSK